jgi:hypothetical protein
MLLPKDEKSLFRAQRGCDWTTKEEGDGIEVDVETAFGRDRMVPKAEFVGDGRVNPARIPCLYLATLPSTAWRKCAHGLTPGFPWQNSI